MRTDEEYKKLSIGEFTRAAEHYEGDEAGMYKMCQDDYPFILDEIRGQDFEDLLDVGCGTGPMISLLAKEYPDKHYVGVDLTPKMIEVAKAKNLANTEWIVGDAENLPIGDACYDIVINSQSYHHYPNPQAFMNEVMRVLRPGGLFVMRDNTTDNKALAWAVNHIELPLANVFGKGDVRMSTLDEVRTYCENAGLVVDKLEGQKKFRLHLVAHKPE